MQIHLLDISAIFKLEDIIEKFKEKELEIVLVMRHRHKKRILSIDDSGIFKNIKIYKNIDDAINYLKEINSK